jgi:aminoglycoside phosphotransferase
MDKKQIQEISLIAGIGNITSVKNINIGFSNKIQLINDRYILKTTTKTNNNLIKEFALLTFFKNKLPVPKIIHADFSRNFVEPHFILMKKIEGLPLYQVWSSITENERKLIIKQISDYLKLINNSDLTTLKKHFNKPGSWKLYVKKRFEKIQAKHLALKIIDKKLLNNFNRYLNNKLYLFDEAVIRPIYYDIHFDNFIVKNKKVVGILDFESIKYLLLDYSLLAIKRMCDIPKEFASEAFENSVIEKDYKQIYQYFKDYYPELYNFNEVEKRVKIYSMIYDLEILVKYPKADDRIARVENEIKSVI